MPRAAADPAADFRALFDALFAFVARHPRAGPKMADLGLSGRGVFPDLKLVLNVAPAGTKVRARGVHVTWSWGAAPKGFVAQVLVSCPSAVANRLCQGKENPALALDRGDLSLSPLDPSVNERRLLDLLPVLVPLRSEVPAVLRKAGLARLIL
ncbi:MAG: hypothetical protein RBU36_04095 [Thermoanaerobaculia bacterium]|jgi:hypothetical protein|nr:hypothetical protein [Thermoanaerobaculia bacterium]